MARFRVIQEQTQGGCFNSTISQAEAISFNLLTSTHKEEYLQEHYFSKGHGEGANNLINLAHAIKEFGMLNVSSYTILLT